MALDLGLLGGLGEVALAAAQFEVFLQVVLFFPLFDLAAIQQFYDGDRDRTELSLGLIKAVVDHELDDTQHGHNHFVLGVVVQIHDAVLFQEFLSELLQHQQARRDPHFG